MPRPISLRLEKCNYALVADLKNPHGEGWDMAKLQLLFTFEEVRLITSTALSAMGTNDILIWKHVVHGQYDVDSGYKLAHKMKRQRPGGERSSRSVEDEKIIWHLVWGLNLEKKSITFCGSASTIAFL